MTTIRRGNPTDFATVMARVAASFREGNPGHLLFEELYPDSVRADAESMGQWWLAEEAGEILAGLQIVPRPMVAAGTARVLVGGLGNVFCCPPQRGRGLMSRLLERSIEGMAADGYALSMLGGDRQRYGNFGWEHAGTSRALSLSGGTLRHRQADPVSGTSLRTWTGDDSDTRRMHAAYEALPYRTVRGTAEFPAVLRRPGHVVWICDDPEAGFAYACVRGWSIAEYAGDEDALRRLVRFFLRSGGFSVSVPPVSGSTPVEEMLLEHSRHYSVECTAMIRIISLLRTLESYGELLNARLSGWRGEVVLGAGEETVRIEGDGRSLAFSEAPGAAGGGAFSLCEAARLLFGPFPPRHAGSEEEFLRRAFPLPIHWHSLSHV